MNTNGTSGSSNGSITMGAGGGGGGTMIFLQPGQKMPKMAAPHFCNICLIRWKCGMTKKGCSLGKILTCNSCYDTLYHTKYRNFII